MFSHRCQGVFAVGCALVLTGLAGCALLSKMTISPTSIDFGQTETSKTFNVSFSGVGLVWAAGTDAAWLTLIPEAGRGASTVTVTVNRSALPAESNTATILVVDQNQKQSMVQVTASKAPGGGDNGGGGNVPNVVGQAQAAAEAAITAAGLTVGTVTQQCSDSVAKGNVISQNPAGGTTVAAGTSVSLVVSSGPCGGGGVLEGKWYAYVETYEEEKEALKSVAYLGSMTFQGGTVEYAESYTYPQGEKGLSEEDKEAMCSGGYFIRGTYSANAQASPGQVDMTFIEEGWYECCGDECDGETETLSEPMPLFGIFTFLDGKLVISADTQARPASFADCVGDGPQWVLIPESQLASHPYWDGWQEYEDAYAPDCGKDGAVVQGKNPLDRVKGLMRR